MAYYSGSANDLAAIRAALVSACEDEGWSWSSGTEVLSKSDSFLRITIGANGILLLGRTSAAAGPAPNAVRVGRMFSASGQPTFDITFPAAYEIFGFGDEIFMVIRYDIDRYQWLAFGKSSVAGLPGSGMWLGASLGETLVTASSGISVAPINIGADGGGNLGGYNAVCPALFHGAVWNGFTHASNSFVHSDLDSDGWRLGYTNIAQIGIQSLSPLLSLLPSAWNSEAVLLPLRAYKMRPSNRVSLVCDIENARHTRIDHYEPGQVISIGGERWKVFPWHRKNGAARNGGAGIDHTGTMGWALRYEGP